MLWRIAGLIMVLALVAACGQPTSTESSAETATPVPTSGGSTAPAGGSTAQVDAMIATWTRSGGLAGRTESMQIYADGRVVLDADGTTRTATVPPMLTRSLQEALTGSAFQALEAEYGQQSPDAFQYTVQAGSKTVRTYDGVENPPALAAVLGQLNALYGMASRGQ